MLILAINLSPDVCAQGNPSITTSTITPGVLGKPYSFTVTGAGGVRPYTWSATGMPPGLSINPSNGTQFTTDITDTPTSAGNFTVTITLTDFTSVRISKSLPFTIYTPLLVTTTTESLPPGTVDTDYPNTSLAATGGATPYAWKLATGSSLPDGLSLSGGGSISGKPKNSAIGTTSFTVQVNDNGNLQTASKVLSITVAAPVSITTSSPLPNGMLGMSYSQTLAATGGTQPYTWSVTTGTPPGGIALSPGGVLSGTPTGLGMTNFTVQVADSASPARTATKQFALTIIPPPLSIGTSSPLPNGTVGTAYSQTLAASGGVSPYSWSITQGTPPAGLTLSPGGVLSGMTTTAATANFTVQVRDSASQTATKQFALTIDPPPLTITTPSPLPNGTANTAYSQTLAATGGTPTYTWSVTQGTLPGGLTLSGGGVISGTPTQGVANFTVQVRDTASRTATKAFTITVISSTFTLTNVPDTMQPAQQVAIGLTVPSAPSNPISGTLNLSFASSSVVSGDDPAVMFSNGSDTVSFTIPANSTVATLNPAGTMLQTGTVSGTITVTVKANIQSGATDVPVKTVTVPKTVPMLTNITAVRISGGLRVQVTGYSPERQVINVDFGFDVKTSSGTQRVTLSRGVQQDFDGWYKSSASSAFGSSFVFEQMFTVQGDNSMINSVTVSLTNGQGPGTANPAQFR